MTNLQWFDLFLVIFLIFVLWSGFVVYFIPKTKAKHQCMFDSKDVVAWGLDAKKVPRCVFCNKQHPDGDEEL